jgi:hypothetical protein
MIDLPDFSDVIWNQREVKSRDVEIQYIVYVPVLDVNPGDSYYAEVFTVPVGRRHFVSDCYGAMTFRGALYVYIPGSHDIYSAFFEPYDTHFASLALPIPIESGQTLRVSWENHDIVKGTFRILIGVWWEPGSKWQPPKNDDPSERFLKGDFNYAKYFLNNDGPFVVIFRKAKEDKSNYVKIENPWSRTKKVLASFHLKQEEAVEIENIGRAEPKKVKEVLEKFEEKYKPRKFFGL